MATARSVIKSSLRLISAIAVGETPTAEEATDGLETLNDMLHSWALHGVELDHTTLTLDDTVQLPDNHLKGVKYVLALTLGTEYGLPVKPEIAAIAAQEWTKIKAHHATVEDMALDHALAWNPSKRTWWNN